MAGVLQIQEPVVTEQVLRRHHAGQGEVRVSAQAVITPTGWDYLRRHRLRLVGGAASSPTTHPQAPVVPPASPGSAEAARGAIPEVLPPGSDAGVLSRGRYDHPDRSFGCRTEEFGSGFVEPSSCGECAERRASGAGSCGCGGCNKAGDVDLEALVQRLTDEIMTRLGGG